MAEGVGMISLHDPRAHKHGHVNTSRFVIQQTCSSPPGRSEETGGLVCCLTKEAEAIVSDEASFTCKQVHSIETTAP